MNEYSSITLRKEFLQLIDKSIAVNPIYNSRAEFVKQAIREKLERLQGGG